MIIFSNTYPVRDESSVEENDASYTPHSVRNADKLHNVAYLTACSLCREIVFLPNFHP